jgi:charged multivesicular body protein 1
MLEKGDKESARVYASNAIREKNQALNYLRLASRIDGVASRLQSAIDQQNVAKLMGKVSRDLDVAMKSMNPAMITATMDAFERQVEDIDVRTGVMEKSMEGATAVLTPDDEVQNLINAVADEHGLDLDAAFAAAGRVGTGTGTKVAETEDDLLTDRLAKLRSTA